jgi:hypothetical protein
VARNEIRSRGARVLIIGLTALVLAGVFLEYPAHGRGAAGAVTQSSSQVAVVPGFTAPVYPGYYGVPKFPATDPQLAHYHFSQLAATHVNTAALASYDTVILYGIRWSDLSPAARTAINTFARTHKVVIWDSDGTGSQNYSSFIHPFSDTASGENGKANNSVVSFPSGVNFLASDKPSSPYYLDPNQLVTDKNMINDMSAMKTGTANWLPALVAANKTIPNGGWALAWSYGVIGDHTGLTIYSGIDADAFADQLNPNYAIKEVALDLAAPFRSTPDPACAPGCHLPSSGGGTTYASCAFAKPVPKHWVHGRVAIALKASVASGITGQVLDRRGRVVASANEGKGGMIRLLVKTKRLPTNRTSRLQARVFVDGKPACTKPFRLKVDNTRPRLLLLHTSVAGGHVVTLRVSELASMSFVGRHVRHHRPVLIAARRTIHWRLPTSVMSARLILRDRAGNTVTRRLVW